MRAPAFQLYPDDFLAGTITMTNEEVGCYWRLLCKQWSQGFVTEMDMKRMATLSFQGDLEAIKCKFTPDKEGRYRNERLEAERRKQQEYRENQSKSGKQGAQKRWGRHSDPIVSPMAKGMAKHSSPSPSPNKTVHAPSGEHGAFIDGWCQNYESVFGVKYQFDKGRDGKAVKELLGMGIMRIDLLEIAKKAWCIKSPTFETGKSVTISGFRCYFNQIQVQTKNGAPAKKKESLI